MGHFAQTPHGSDMADAAPAGDRGGFRGGFGDRGRGGRGRGDRGRGRGDRGRGRGRGKEEKEWIPVTKLGRLVKEGSTGTLGNFAKATYAAIAETYSYLTPD